MALKDLDVQAMALKVLDVQASGRDYQATGLNFTGLNVIGLNATHPKHLPPFHTVNRSK